MQSRRSLVTGIVVLALACVGTAAAPAQTPGSSPAATLLLPYFEVDLSGPEAMTTLFSVNNAADDPVVAHVVVWTDWGIPTYSFDLALGADDVQTVNLRDLFATGSVPVTDGTAIPGCANQVEAPPLAAAALAAFQDRHAGRPDPDSGLCYGSDQPGGTTFAGYLTVDAAHTCAGAETYFPGDDGYFFLDFGGVPPGGGAFASEENVLWGDLFYVAGSEDSAQGVELVHVPHHPEAAAGETFYRRVSPGGHDGRVGLGSRYRGRYLEGGAFDGGTDLLVWLDSEIPGEPVACGTRETHIDICQGAQFRFYDEEGAFVGETHRDAASLAFRLPVAGLELPALAPFGFFELDHQVVVGCFILPIGTFPVQAWVMPVMKAQGRFSVGLPATRIPIPEQP